MKHHSSPFKWRHDAPKIILLCVRRYCRDQLPYRDGEEMMRERGLDVDHSTVFRWVQRYVPEINKRVQPHLKMSGTSYRVEVSTIADATVDNSEHCCKYDRSIVAMRFIFMSSLLWYSGCNLELAYGEHILYSSLRTLPHPN